MKYHLGLSINCGKIAVCVLDENGALTEAGTFENLPGDTTSAVNGIDHFIKTNIKDSISGAAMYHSKSTRDILLAGQLLYMLRSKYVNRVHIENDWIRTFNDVMVEAGGDCLKDGDGIQWADLVDTCTTLFRGVQISNCYIPAACLTAISAGRHS